MPDDAECSRAAAGCLPPPDDWTLVVTESQLVLTPAGGEYPDQPITDMSDPSADEGTIVLGDSPLPCIVTTGPAGEGEYTWTLEADTLTLEAEHDDCADRVLILTTVPWTREAAP